MFANYTHLEMQVMRVIVLLGVFEERSSVNATYINKLERVRAQV